MEAIVFPQVLEKYKNLLLPDSKVYIKGRIDYKEEEAPKLLVEEVKPLEKDAVEGTVVFIVSKKDNINMNNVREFVSSHKGNSQVVIYVKETGKSFLLDSRIDPSVENLNLLAENAGLRDYIFWDKQIVNN